MAEFICSECGDTHRDGDEIETIAGPGYVMVKCVSHSIWANRRIIQALLDSWKLSKDYGSLNEYCN